MPCYHPVPAFQDGAGAPVVLWPPFGQSTFTVPCGTCLGCRQARAQEWALRCEHEGRSWANNCFLTLTYDEAHLPPHGHLNGDDLAGFLKRLRERCKSVYSPVVRDPLHGFRFFACGEYGELNGRPHYHCILFNCSFSDVVVCGKNLWRSAFVNAIWRCGDVKIGDFSPASAMYVAQYSVKKQRLGCDVDGVVRPAPFLRMSLKPPIGYYWVRRWKEDLQHGYVPDGTDKLSIPRTYVGVVRGCAPDVAAAMEVGRAARGHALSVGGDAPARRVAAETIHRARLAVGSRKL